MLLFWILITVSVVGIIGCIFMMYRNMQVYNFRIYIIERVSELTKAEASRFVDRPGWEWRYDIYHNGPTYNDMLYHFWRPLTPKNWYDDLTFLQP